MEILNLSYRKLIELIPSGMVIIAVLCVFFFIRFMLNKRFVGLPNQKFRYQIILLFLSFIGLLIIIVALPLKDTTTGQLLSLIGILLSAAIALSATTFVGNIMGGMMIRAVRNFRPGDFIQVNEFFGRVSELGLFHVEIQTEDSDLITMPTLYLVTNPVKVTRKSETIISAQVSLGYDISSNEIENALLKAAEEIGLQECFVQIMELGDFSVNYRVSGLLTDTKNLITSRSNLRIAMLEELHKAKIEIVSPTFMNQRLYEVSKKFIPEKEKKAPPDEKERVKPEDLVFSKAEEAESIEKLHARSDEIKTKISQLKDSLSETDDKDEKEKISAQIKSLKARIKHLTQIIIERQDNEK